MVKSFCVAGLFALSLEAVTSQSPTPNPPDVDGYTNIICPFLSTLIHERAIPVQEYYQKEELTAVVLNAGLNAEETIPHIHAQFRNIRSGRIDIFNLEGLPDEHYSSSGINDCNTDYTHWDQCPTGPRDSSTQGVRVCETTECTVPSQYRSLGFWDHFDPDKTGYLTVKNLQRLADSFAPFANDINEDPGVEGKIDDAYMFLIHVFKEYADQMSNNDFTRIVMERMYPVGYEYGRGCDTNSTQNPQQDFPYYSAYPFGIRDSYGRWLSLSGSTGVVVTSDKTVWTADPTDDGYTLRASGPSTYEAGLFLNYDGEDALAGDADKVTSWVTVQVKDKVLLQAVTCDDSPCRGYLSADTYGNVRMSSSASTNEMFDLVYCALPLDDDDTPPVV